MTPGAQLQFDQRIAQADVAKALVLLLSLHDTADSVQLRAEMKDGRVVRSDVTYSQRGVTLGGFGS